MQFCPKCGKEVKYIATGYESIAACETEEITVINDKGYKYKGYPLHKCKEDINTDERNNDRQ